MGILDGIVEWIAEQVMAGLDSVSYTHLLISMLYQFLFQTPDCRFPQLPPPFPFVF